MALYTPGDFLRRLDRNPSASGFSPSEPYRSDFRRDYARLVHSAAFRRLNGKTQLFPGIESDFFRNRLTHSLEVAQVAKSIAIKLNHEYSFFKDRPIDTDLVEIAGLAHDLGHPPFGHNGELALDRCMIESGGFEGNAQTLRILARLEKKATSDKSGNGVTPDGEDLRFGLDLCMRTMASVLKYDRPIPKRRSLETYAHPEKGYYESEAEIVQQIKEQVLRGAPFEGKFKTIECQIMDVADDIAYSTYDLEDAFKAGLLTPMDLLAAPKRLLEKVVAEVNRGGGWRV
jgi:dGTPase